MLFKESSSRSRWYSRLLIVLAFLIVIVLSFAVSWRFFEGRTERDASEVGADFPVVVMTPGRSEIVSISALDDYAGSHTEYSMLVPDGQDDIVTRQLSEYQRTRHSSGVAQLRVERLSTGKQIIELDILDDGFVISRYEASAKEVRPLTIKLAGPLFIIFPCGISIIAGFFFVGLLKLGSFLLRTRQTAKLA